MNNGLMRSSPDHTEEMRLTALYALMEKQVISYQKFHHLGYSTSVSTELAKELMDSILYTLEQLTDVYDDTDLEKKLTLGQAILEEKLAKAKSMLQLIVGTAPQWQTQCRWEAIECLRRYLSAYDVRHLANRGPDAFFYPTLCLPPEGVKGIDLCLFYEQSLWIENQIMAGISEESLAQFWDCLPSETLNQCEQVVINALGKTIIGQLPDPLQFQPEHYRQIGLILPHVTDADLKDATLRLCDVLGLREGSAFHYIHSAARAIMARANAQNLPLLFL